MRSRNLRLLGFTFSFLPPVIATLTYFPLWYSRGIEFFLSGLTLLFLLISAIPLIRIIKNKLKSPSAPLIWLVFFLFFFAVDKISDKCVIISFIGFLGNAIGTAFYKLDKMKGKNRGERYDEED